MRRKRHGQPRTGSHESPTRWAPPGEESGDDDLFDDRGKPLLRSDAHVLTVADFLAEQLGFFHAAFIIDTDGVVLADWIHDDRRFDMDRVLLEIDNVADALAPDLELVLLSYDDRPCETVATASAASGLSDVIHRFEGLLKVRRWGWSNGVAGHLLVARDRTRPAIEDACVRRLHPAADDFDQDSIA